MVEMEAKKKAQAITPEQLAATDRMMLEAWCKSNPGHHIVDGKIVRDVKEAEPGPEALFKE